MSFLHRYRQVCRQFYILNKIFERDMQFWYTKIGNFHDVFMGFNEWRHFYTKKGKFADNFLSWTRYIRWIFWIFLVPRKQIVPINAACFPCSETTKIPILPQTDLHKNYVMAIWQIPSCKHQQVKKKKSRKKARYIIQIWFCRYDKFQAVNISRRKKMGVGVGVGDMVQRTKRRTSPAGNWTPVSRVTGGDTDHYTTEDHGRQGKKYLLI